MRVERKAEPITKGFASTLLMKDVKQVSYIIRHDF